MNDTVNKLVDVSFNSLRHVAKTEVLFLALNTEDSVRLWDSVSQAEANNFSLLVIRKVCSAPLPELKWQVVKTLRGPLCTYILRQVFRAVSL